MALIWFASSLLAPGLFGTAAFAASAQNAVITSAVLVSDSPVQIHPSEQMCNQDLSSCVYPYSIVDNGDGTATATTYESWIGARAGENIVLSGLIGSGAAYNGSHTVTATSGPSTPSTFTFPISGSPANWTQDERTTPVLLRVGSTIARLYHYHCCGDTGEDRPGSEIRWQTSSDGGNTWSAEVTLFANSCARGTTCGFVNLQGGPTDDGAAIIMWSVYQFTPLKQFVETRYSRWDGVAWSTPQVIPPAIKKHAFITTSGSITVTADGTTLLAPMWDADTSDFYMYKSTDHGVTWPKRVRILDPDNKHVALPAWQNEISGFANFAGTNYIAFGRGCVSSSALPTDCRLWYIWSADGIHFSAGQTSLAYAKPPSGWATNNYVSPALTPAINGLWTLIWYERQDSTSSYLRTFSFDPVSTFGNPSAFAGGNTLWSGHQTYGGYPSFVRMDDGSVVVSWYNEAYAGDITRIHTIVAKYVVSNP